MHKILLYILLICSAVYPSQLSRLRYIALHHIERRVSKRQIGIGRVNGDHTYMYTSPSIANRSLDRADMRAANID